MQEQWWLASLDRYGNPTLVDGAHSDRTGVEKALYLRQRLSLAKDERYGAVRLEVFDVEPVAYGANEEAVDIVNSARYGDETHQHQGVKPMNCNDTRIKQLMEQVGFPDSLSHYQAFKQMELEAEVAADARNDLFRKALSSISLIEQDNSSSAAEKVQKMAKVARMALNAIPKSEQKQTKDA